MREIGEISFRKQFFLYYILLSHLLPDQFTSDYLSEMLESITYDA